MRLRGTTGSALEEIGEDTEGLIEDFSKLNGKIKDLTKTANSPSGVSIVDQMTGGYKSTYQILKEISEVWKDIGDMQKAELLEIMAGKVRATAAAAILESPEILTQAYEDAMTKAAGAGERAVTTSMESIEKKSAVLKNNLSQLARDVIDSKMVKEIIDSLNELIKDVRQTGQDIAPVISGLMEILNIVTKIASIAPTGTLVGTLLAKNRVFGADNGLNKGIIKTLGLAQPTAAISQSELQIIKNAAADTNTYAEACGRLNDSMESLSPVAQEFVKTQIATNESSQAVIAACEKQAKVTRTLTIAQGLLNTALSIGISVVTSLALRAISNWIHAEENARKETHEMLSSLKASTEEYKKQEQAIADVIKKYKEYNGVLQDDKATESDLYTAKQNLYDLQEDINSQFNITAEGLDLVNGKYYEQLQLLSDIEDKSRNAYIAENAGAYQSAQEAINDRGYIRELIDSSSYSSGNRAIFFINFLKDLLKQYNADIDTVNVQDFKDIIDTTIADFASGNRASAEALVKNAGLSEEYIDVYQAMLEDLSKTWGNIVNNAESSLNNALDAEQVIKNYESVLVSDNPAFTALSDNLNDYIKRLGEAQVSGDKEEYQRLYKITTDYLNGASKIIPYDSIINGFEDQITNINDAYERAVAKELQDAQDIRERVENILNSKILGWNNGVQDANRQFTHMGYYGDPKYGAPLKWNEQEIKKAFEDLQVDTWEEINLFDDVIKEAVESGTHDINDLFDLYKRRLKELNETKKEVFDYTNWLTFDSNLNKDKDNKYKNNELISAYQSAVAGFKEYLEQNEQGEIEINLGKIATYVGDTELFAQLGMESFDSYVKAFTDEAGNVSKSDVLGTYIKDVFAKAIRSVSSSELTEEGYQLLTQAFDNINSEILGVSESVFKIEDSYWELRKLQTDVNNGVKFSQEEAVDLMNKYNELYGSVESVTEEVNKETGELIKMYKFEEGSIDSLVGRYASLSNEAITSLKDQSKYFTETIKYLRQMQIELVQATVDAAMLRSGLTFNVDLKAMMNTDANQADISRAISESIKGLDEDTQKSINKVISEGQQRVWNIMHGADLTLKVGDGTKTGNGDGTDESKANLDWLEQYLEKRNRLVEEKNKEYENLMKMTMSGKNIEGKYYDQRKVAMEAANVALEEQRKAYQVAEEEYMRRMTSGVLYNELAEAAGGEKAAKALVNKIMAGESFNLESMSSELSSAIGAMVDNWNNKRDAAEKQIEIGIQIKDNDLAQKKEDIERIVNKYDRVLKEFEQRKGTLEHYQTMQTTEGLMQNEKVIIAQINLETKALANNIAKRDQLTAELKSFIPTTEDELNHWYDLKGQIDETTSAIYANQEAIAAWQNEVKKLEWDLDDKINQIRYKVTDEADFLINNLSSNDMYKYVREYLGNDAEKTKLYNGDLSDEGLATLAMHIVKRRSFYEEIKEYNKRIAEAEALYLQDSANVENLEHLDKLRSEQRQIIENYNDEKQAVVDLVKEGYDKQLESLDALINKYMEALTAERNLYSYQKGLEKQTKNITNLRKQMAAYANASDEESKMRLQQLQVQLQDAEESRSDTEYQRHLEDQQAILDRMYQSLEDYFNDKLEDSDAILNEAKNLVRDNLPSVKNTLDSSLAFSKQATAHITETMDNVLNTDIKNIKGSTAVVDGNVSLIKDSVLKTTPELEAYYKQYADEQIKRTALYANVETLKDAADDFNTNLIALAAKFDKEVVTATKQSTTSPTTSAISTIAGVKLQPVTSNVLGSTEFAKEYNTYMSQIYKNMTQRGMSLDSAINRVFALPQSVSYNMSINLDNVTDYNSFIDECKKNRSFENLIQTMTYNMMNNNSNSLKKYNT